MKHEINILLFLFHRLQVVFQAIGPPQPDVLVSRQPQLPHRSTP